MTPLLRAVAFVALANMAGDAFAQAPTVDQALALKPIQKGVEYDTPSAADAKACSIKAEREGKSTSWVVRDAAGRRLRRFADANADKVVDTWCYYANGLEVYRDIDADFDGRADQYRWLHTGGSRWGLDDNEDTKIDSWKQISPQELAEEAFLAVQTRDADRFERLLLTDREARALGLGEDLRKRFTKSLNAAPSDFKALLRSQKSIDGESRFVDFGAPRPGVIPAGTDGAKKDLLVYENASALVDTGGAPEQLLLGSLVRVGDGWRLVEAPRAGEGGPELANVFSIPSGGLSPSAAPGAPSQKVQAWMSELDKLDRQAATAKPADRDKLTDRRVELLEKLASTAPNNEEAAAWYRQLAGLLNAAVTADGYRSGLAKLDSLAASAGVRRVGDDLVAHFRYQKIGAASGYAFRNPKADFAKVQEKWIADLEAFVEKHPRSQDTPEALLQLGSMAGEFVGETKTAERWYRQAAREFPRSVAGKKAAGALKRLDSIGKPFGLTGATLSGKRADLSRAPYRGRYVLIHYWTTWSGPEADLAAIGALRRKYRGKFEVLGVNLDNDTAAAKAFVAKNRADWEHLADSRGLDGEQATGMGVINLPLMLLVDDRGRVVNRNLTAGELEAELKRVVR